MKSLLSLLWAVFLCANITSQTITWSTVGNGSNDQVKGIVVSGSNIYVGGAFSSAGGNTANYVAKWNGSTWSSLGSGASATVNCITARNDTVYIGGIFTTAGGINANRVAMWDGSSWNALGSGVDDEVYSMFLDGDNLYVGGKFTSAGGSSANSIAKWNGSSWSALSSGLNDQVDAIFVSGGSLYAGGKFSSAGGSSASSIAKWDGSSWSEFQGGANDQVTSIYVSGSNVYIGGIFSTVGASSINYLAHWNGSAWSNIGSGVNAAVYSIIANESEVYVGGIFTTAGGITANKIAKWNGSSWSSLGGADDEVDAMAIKTDEGKMYIGGKFSNVNTENSSLGASNVASFSDADNPLPVELTSFSAEINDKTIVLNWNTATETNNYGFDVERRDNNNNWETIAFIEGNGTSNSPNYYSFSDNSFINAGNYLYRLKQIDLDGGYSYSDEVKIEFIVNKFSLEDNYPNPFNPTTIISYNLPKEEFVELIVYDMLGKKVVNLVNSIKKAGSHKVSFTPNGLSSGNYLYRIQAGSFVKTKKMLLIK